jgi:hypothetical protein
LVKKEEHSAKIMELKIVLLVAAVAFIGHTTAIEIKSDTPESDWPAPNPADDIPEHEKPSLYDEPIEDEEQDEEDERSVEDADEDDDVKDASKQDPWIFGRGKSSYMISVHTSNKWWAGTAAHVSIRIYGSQGNTGHMKMLKHSSNHAKPFVAGQTDKFNVFLPEVGRINKIYIGHDNTGSSPGWHLAQVSIRHHHCTTIFKVGKWFSGNHHWSYQRATSHSGACSNWHHVYYGDAKPAVAAKAKADEAVKEAVVEAKKDEAVKEAVVEDEAVVE